MKFQIKIPPLIPAFFPKEDGETAFSPLTGGRFKKDAVFCAKRGF
jgi:hypothetical protein